MLLLFLRFLQCIKFIKSICLMCIHISWINEYTHIISIRNFHTFHMRWKIKQKLAIIAVIQLFGNCGRRISIFLRFSINTGFTLIVIHHFLILFVFHILSLCKLGSKFFSIKSYLFAVFLWIKLHIRIYMQLYYNDDENKILTLSASWQNAVIVGLAF